MERAIVGFYRDGAWAEGGRTGGGWLAALECGHGKPACGLPLFGERPWAMPAEDRASKPGERLDCLRCERFELPPGLQAYRRTPEFDEISLPAGLRREHRTRAGVWGLIHVLEGRLRYRAAAREPRVATLEPGTPGVVVPEMAHHVEPLGPVRLYVEFLRVDGPGRPAAPPPPAR